MTLALAVSACTAQGASDNAIYNPVVNDMVRTLLSGNETTAGVSPEFWVDEFRESHDARQAYFTKQCTKAKPEAIKKAMADMLRAARAGQVCDACKPVGVRWLQPPEKSGLVLSPIGRSDGLAFVCADYHPGPLHGEQRCYLIDERQRSGAAVLCTVSTMFY